MPAWVPLTEQEVVTERDRLRVTIQLSTPPGLVPQAMADRLADRMAQELGGSFRVVSRELLGDRLVYYLDGRRADELAPVESAALVSWPVAVLVAAITAAIVAVFGIWAYLVTVKTVERLVQDVAQSPPVRRLVGQGISAVHVVALVALGLGIIGFGGLLWATVGRS